MAERAAACSDGLFVINWNGAGKKRVRRNAPQPQQRTVVKNIFTPVHHARSIAGQG
jgi:archaeosine-15-forming tRNA-guanine transglycosylase